MHDPHLHTGASASMYEMIDQLNKDQNFNIHVCLPNYRCPKTTDYLKQRNIKYIQKTYFSNRILQNSVRNLNILYCVKMLIKLFLTLWSGFIFSKKARDFDIIYSNTTDNLFGLISAKFAQVPHICHIREYGLRDQNVRQIIGDRFYYRILTKYSQRLICISKNLQEYVDSRNANIQTKTTLVYDYVYLDYSSNIIRNFQKLHFMIAGSIIEGKGQLFLINALDLLKKKGLDVNLSIFGDCSSSYCQKLQNYVTDLGLSEQVSFEGFSHCLQEERKKFDFAVMASNSEAFGRVTVEAMHAGQIILATNSGANPEIITHGVTGFLYENGDLDSFVRGVFEIYNKTETDLKLISEQSQLASKVYTAPTAHLQINKILQEVTR